MIDKNNTVFVEKYEYKNANDLLNMNYTFNEGDNVTITAEFIDYLENLKKENELLKKKLNKAIELLIEYNMPCEMNDFMNKNVDYCSSNCGVDKEVFKKCWLRYIEQELEK